MQYNGKTIYLNTPEYREIIMENTLSTMSLQAITSKLIDRIKSLESRINELEKVALLKVSKDKEKRLCNMSMAELCIYNELQKTGDISPSLSRVLSMYQSTTNVDRALLYRRSIADDVKSRYTAESVEVWVKTGDLTDLVYNKQTEKGNK